MCSIWANAIPPLSVLKSRISKISVCKITLGPIVIELGGGDWYLDNDTAGPFVRYRYIHKGDTFLNTNQIDAVEAPNMRLEWPVYAFTAGVFLTFALSVQFLSLGTFAVVGLFVLLTVAYAWVAWVMIKQKAVLELHAYNTCNTCGVLTPSQGKHCMNCGVDL